VSLESFLRSCDSIIAAVAELLVVVVEIHEDQSSFDEDLRSFDVVIERRRKPIP
jgi:hypothetical protein